MLEHESPPGFRVAIVHESVLHKGGAPCPFKATKNAFGKTQHPPVSARAIPAPTAYSSSPHQLQTDWHLGLKTTESFEEKKKPTILFVSLR